MARRLQPADDLLAPAVTETIKHLTTSAEDAAAVKLAQRYAATIDAAEDRDAAMEKLGPKLLACLESLGATPAARARLKGGAPSAAGNRLAALREARRAN
jgi:hypothetical protein